MKTPLLDLGKIGNHSGIDATANPTEQIKTREELAVGEVGEPAESLLDGVFIARKRPNMAAGFIGGW